MRGFPFVASSFQFDITLSSDDHKDWAEKVVDVEVEVPHR
jgi:hypothetical protein